MTNKGMQAKKQAFLLGLALCLLLAFCAQKYSGRTIQELRSGNNLIEQAPPLLQYEDLLGEGSNDYDTAMELYQEFLNGELSVDYLGEPLDMDAVTIPTGEPDSSYFTKHAYYDSDGDQVPELHICSARYYYVLTCRDSELFVWKNLSPYPCYYALNDGAFISWDQRAGYESATYYRFDYDGTEKYTFGFSRYDIDNDYEWEETDKYNFNGEEVTREAWTELTAPYLDPEGGIREDIQDQIEWTVDRDGV